MKKVKFAIPYNSIRFKIFMPILLAMFPLFVFIGYYNFYIIRVLHNQVADSYNNLLSVSMNQLDNQLRVIQTYLSDTATLDSDVAYLQNFSDRNDNFYTVIRIKNKLMTDVSMLRFINFVFIYNIDTADFISAYDDSSSSYDESQLLTEYYTGTIGKESENAALDYYFWNINKVGDSYYLYRIIRNSNIYVGSCINISGLINELYSSGKMKDVTILMLDENKRPVSETDFVAENSIDFTNDTTNYYITGESNKFLVMGTRLIQDKFSLAALIPEKVIMQNLPFIQVLIYIIIIFSLISLTLSIIYLRKLVIYPLNRLTKTMKVIQEGNIDTRITPFRTTNEFLIVNETFNKMMDEIEQLKIDIYEEQVLQHKEELRRLQVEINPHFFLNSLNIIYSLTETHDYELIKEMTICLIKYFRFIFNTDRNQITLKQELEHVQNYIRIQELRYPESFQYVIDIPESLYNCLVPPL